MYLFAIERIAGECIAGHFEYRMLSNYHACIHMCFTCFLDSVPGIIKRQEL